MPPKHELLTDDYVAEMLAKEAADCSVKYSAIGLEAFNQPAKRPAHQPKPNTRFLNSIIRDTTNHNRALLAKESADSAQRLRSLDRSKESERQSEQDRHRRQRPDPKDTRKRMLGDIAAIIGDSSKRRRVDDGADRSARPRPTRDTRDDTSDAPTELRIKGRSTRRDEDPFESRSGNNRNARKELFADPVAKDPISSTSSRRDSTRELFADHDERHGLARPRRRNSRSRERHDRDGKSHSSSSRHRHHSTRERHNNAGESSSNGKHRERRGSHGKGASPPHSHSRRPRSPVAARDDSDSDPLEDMIGPAPPSQAQPVRKRGRGAVAGTSGIDRRFASDYDPKADVALDGEDDDDWGTSLEALRDRQRWKQQGGDRLRAAGFSEEQVKKWERGGQDGWGNREEDVRWVKHSEEREWDRGKSATLLEDGTLD
ncbi:hypothetical protein PG994_005221 [Apiospora phragmitis]|uniref:Pre-mRNA-splicing factor 38B n=1 Tax=Apiospora phragmitis TaxID=2905665 RepID=A0ABR1VT28_9PEZI